MIVMIRYRLIFTGHVQQVGFRFYSVTCANENNCTGWVRNLNDGSVVMEIQGNNNQIDNVINSLKAVKHITIESINKMEIPLQHDTSFEITF